MEEDGKLYRLERRLFPDGSEEVDRVEMDPTDGEATCLEHHIGRQPTSVRRLRRGACGRSTRGPEARPLRRVSPCAGTSTRAS